MLTALKAHHALCAHRAQVSFSLGSVRLSISRRLRRSLPHPHSLTTLAVARLFADPLHGRVRRHAPQPCSCSCFSHALLTILLFLQVRGPPRPARAPEAHHLRRATPLHRCLLWLARPDPLLRRRPPVLPPDSHLRRRPVRRARVVLPRLLPWRVADVVLWRADGHARGRIGKLSARSPAIHITPLTPTLSFPQYLPV